MIDGIGNKHFQSDDHDQVVAPIKCDGQSGV